MNKVIYQIGSLAGWPHALAKGFREKGIPSINIVMDVVDTAGTTNKFGKSNRQLKYDEYLFDGTSNKFKKMLLRFGLFFRMLKTAKLVHYHGATILPKNIDVLIFNLFKIPTVVTWGGGDARIVEIAAANNPYFFRYNDKGNDKNIRKLLARLARFGAVIATDPEMKLYMKGFFDIVHPFRAPIDVSDLKCNFPSIEKKKPIFLHVPTHSFVKGTVHIENAFKKLVNEGYEFEPLLLDSTLTQEELRNKISECDVYVDELRCGSHGYTALEAAGSGKPTLTFVLDFIIKEFPDEFPFVNTNPDTVYDVIKMLIEKPDLRREIGMNSRAYVEKYHATNVVVDNMIDLYKKLGVDVKKGSNPLIQ